MSRYILAALVVLLFFAVVLEGNLTLRFTPLNWGVGSADR